MRAIYIKTHFIPIYLPLWRGLVLYIYIPTDIIHVLVWVLVLLNNAITAEPISFFFFYFNENYLNWHIHCFLLTIVPRADDIGT